LVVWPKANAKHPEAINKADSIIFRFYYKVLAKRVVNFDGVDNYYSRYIIVITRIGGGVAVVTRHKPIA